MSTFDWPAALKPESLSFYLKKATLQSRSPYSGTLMTLDLASERWMLSINLPPVIPEQSAAREAFLTRLAGGSNWVRMGHALRPIPAGTMRGSPALNGVHARGVLTLSINTTAGATLAAGDLFSLGGQLFMAAADATADGSGVLSVDLINRVRAATASGTAVAWNKPTGDFILPATSVPTTHMSGYADALALDLEEVW